MKVVLDSCIWAGTINVLRGAGYDTIWVGNYFKNDPGDNEILQYAYENDRTLITLDKDFGELAIVKGAPHKGIIRIVNFAAREQGLICVKILKNYKEELKNKALITVDKNKIRVRLAD
ncbi:MAG: DUF5615 family PIN-like protein [Bacteroidota bacterium]